MDRMINVVDEKISSKEFSLPKSISWISIIHIIIYPSQHCVGFWISCTDGSTQYLINICHHGLKFCYEYLVSNYDSFIRQGNLVDQASSTIKYMVRETLSNLINDILYLQFAGSNIANLFPKKVALVLSDVIMWEISIFQNGDKIFVA